VYFRRSETDENRPKADENSYFRRPADEIKQMKIGSFSVDDENNYIFVGQLDR
jgi:hypothetical protein